ncbi:MAG TPA: hypothetical protein V6C81_31730 [Planktothrix sp.]|jgi:hypothetical protein
MTITITSNGFIMFIGIAFLAWLAGNLGSFIGAVISAARRPSTGAENLLVFAGLVQLMFPLQLAKIPIALGAAGIALWLNSAHPVATASVICTGVAVLFMVLVGKTQD